MVKKGITYGGIGLLAAGFLLFGVFKYATNLKEGVELKKEIQQLENEKLRLEIKILKKQCCC